MKDGGHTLVELLVSLVLLQVGILGAVGTCLLATRLMARAEALEWGAAEAQRVLDSLAAETPAAAAGEAPSGPGTLRWTASASGALRVEYLVADTPLVVVEGRRAGEVAPNG